MTGGALFEAALTAAATLSVMLACTALGSAAGGGKGRLPGADTVVGLGLAGGLLTLLAVATRVPVSLWAGLLGGAGIVALGWSAWRRRLPGGPGFAAALLLALPLVAFAALGLATLWDDFTHWLPNAAYVFQHDSLPRPELPPTPSRWPGYPHILPFIVASASWLAGHFLEAAGPVANVALLASVGATITDISAADDRRNLPARLAVAAVAEAAFGLFIPAAFGLFIPGAFGNLIPPVPPNVLYSSYGDTATIATVGVLGLLGVSLLERLAERRDADARALAWRFGLAAAALVNLKQANLVLLALLSLGLLLAAWRSGRLPWGRALRLAPAMLAPAAVVFLAWRHYVTANVAGGEMAFRPPALWNWAVIPQLAQALADQLAQNPAFHLLMWTVALAGLWKLRAPREPAEVLAVVAAVVWIGYNAFLIVVYLGAMTADEASHAADYWRYTPHVGMLAVAAALTWLRQLSWPVPVTRLSQPLLLGLAALLPLSLLVAGPHRLSPLAKEWSMQYRAVGHDLAEILPPNSRLAISVGFVWWEATEDAIEYDLRRLGRDDRGLRRWQGRPLTLAPFQSGEATHLLVMDHLGSRDAMTAPLGIPAVVNESALFEWVGGGFRKIHTWPFPRMTLFK